MSNSTEPSGPPPGPSTESSPLGTNFPVLPLRDVVVYPNMVLPLLVGRTRSVHALEKAMNDERRIFLVTQKISTVDEPGPKDLYSVGTVANVLQLLRLPNHTVKLLVEGVQRARTLRIEDHKDYYSVEVDLLSATSPKRVPKALLRSTLQSFERYVELQGGKIPPEVLRTIVGLDDPDRIADAIAAHLITKIECKQVLLEKVSLSERLKYLVGVLQKDCDILEVEKNIRGRVKNQMEKSQREYYLNEQMKAIQKELEEYDDAPKELDELARRLQEAGLSKEARKKAFSELSKLKKMSPMSAEATVVRNYLDWLLAVPWKGRSRVSRDLRQAEKFLNADHYGLEKVKERILEYLAVQQRVRKMGGPILCLVGPPGVGKTSLGQSIARATHRKFTRMSLGGIRDEAEIRGHRRTYIGSMPGKILQCMSKVGKRNPLFLLDEVDKMNMDFRGDPASALLEVLDPEQNHAFNDHYLEVDFDLSEVLFITTANSVNIPPALLDRMELIRLSGYTEEEKIHIAHRHLMPKQKKANGLREKELTLSTQCFQDIVRSYTRESGVRGLEREIAKICRKTVRRLLDSPSRSCRRVQVRHLPALLGVKRYRFGQAESQNRVGQATGLAWTEVGGDLLNVETAIVSGKGKAIQTGKLGDVMKESIDAAMTVTRSRAEEFGLKKDFFQSHDFHIHVPEGAIPKDGPSAGVAITAALISAVSRRPVRSEVAMTGEITLRGEILPIGGLKEKLLAALRGNIKKVLIPQENERELVELPKNILNVLEIRPVRWIGEALREALQPPPGKPVSSKTEKEEALNLLSSRDSKQPTPSSDDPRPH